MQTKRQRRMTIDGPFAVGVYEVTFARVGRVRRGRRLPPPPRRRRLGSRPATGDRRELGRRAGVRRVALVKDGRGLPAADRGRMGVRGRARARPRRSYTGATIPTAQANYDGLSVPYGSGARGQYRGRPISGRIAFAQRLRPVRRARQRGRAGSGLLRRRGGGLHQTRRPRRLVGIPPPARPFGLSKLVRSDPSQPPQRLPRRPDAHPVND